jgi:hypothetical protein
MALALALGLALTGCGLVPEEQRQTWVVLGGPADWEPPEALVLEIGQTAWESDGGGAAMVETSSILPVRLVGRDSCRLYAEFMAPPGSKWVIRFEGDNLVRIVPADDVDAGPAMAGRALTGCRPG